jgi:anti-sigma B factor antagonist
MHITSLPNAELVLSLHGRFDAHEAPAFRQWLDTTEAQSAAKVVIELSDVVFIDSTALAELVATHRALKGAGRALVLRAPSDSVRVILEVTGLRSLFTVEG